MAALKDVLVVNAGSTSLKLTLVDGNDTSHPVASLEKAPPVDAVGHRVVHGGADFFGPTVIDDAVAAELEALVELAPLHNAPAISAIAEARARLPYAQHVAVFDTAFHRTIPDFASTYLLPARYRERGIRRFGFHGLSVQWCVERVPVDRLVVCHLGGGSSVTAVRDGESVDTSMGFTPLEGVPMTTRSGSVDPGALLYLMREHGLDADELDHALEHESGLAALSGTSGDVRELDPDGIAIAVYVHRIAAAVAACVASLGGLDAIAFTGGIGEHSALVREQVCKRLGFLGDFEVHIVPAREELVIASHVRERLG